MVTLYSVKPRFQRLLEPVVALLAANRVAADTVTWAGLGVSAAAGAATLLATHTPGIVLLVPLLLLTRMAANAVDGQLARRTVPTERGGVLNEVCDAAGDALAYLPFGLLVGGAGWLVAAVVAAGLTAEIAAIAGSSELRRNAGPLGKSDRALAFSLLSLAIFTGVGEPVVTLGLGLMVGLAVLTVRNRIRLVGEA